MDFILEKALKGVSSFHSHLHKSKQEDFTEVL